MLDDLNKIDDLFILTNGSYKSVKPQNGIYYTVDEIKNFVGENFKCNEFYNLKIVLGCDDKSNNKSEPFNLLAYLVTHRYFCGNVLICLKERIL